MVLNQEAFPAHQAQMTRSAQKLLHANATPAQLRQKAAPPMGVTRCPCHAGERCNTDIGRTRYVITPALEQGRALRSSRGRHAASNGRGAPAIVDHGAQHGARPGSGDGRLYAEQRAGAQGTGHGTPATNDQRMGEALCGTPTAFPNGGTGSIPFHSVLSSEESTAL